MKPKKYSEVNYIAVKEKKKIGYTLAIIFLVSALFITIMDYAKLGIKYEALKIENNELLKANEIKDSIISDLQEDNMKLQKKVDNL